LYSAVRPLVLFLAACFALPFLAAELPFFDTGAPADFDADEDVFFALDDFFTADRSVFRLTEDFALDFLMVLNGFATCLSSLDPSKYTPFFRVRSIRHSSGSDSDLPAAPVAPARRRRLFIVT
jgi:hypothetical protein